MAWPAAGASSTMRSAVPARSSCLTLPSTRMSSMPGRRGGDDVEHAAAHEPAARAPQPVVLEVVEERLVGGERAGADSPVAVGPEPPRPDTTSS